MITKEIQRAGISVIQVTNLTKIAEEIGANRISRGNSAACIWRSIPSPFQRESILASTCPPGTKDVGKGF